MNDYHLKAADATALYDVLEAAGVVRLVPAQPALNVPDKTMYAYAYKVDGEIEETLWHEKLEGDALLQFVKNDWSEFPEEQAKVVEAWFKEEVVYPGYQSDAISAHYVITDAHKYALDVIGAIYKPTGKVLQTEDGEVPEMKPVDGFHANVRVIDATGFNPDNIASVAIDKPDHPVRGWA
jgi:hypothetical protein